MHMGCTAGGKQCTRKGRMDCEVHACSMLMMHAAACRADVFTPVLGCSWRQFNTYWTLLFKP